MSRKLDMASAFAVAVTLITALVGAEGSGAIAQSKVPVAVAATAQIATEPTIAMISEPVVQPVIAEVAAPALDSGVSDAASAPKASSLSQLVAAQDVDSELSRELHCLAGAIYFEAKGETLEGQLAVGRVIVARSRSGRFPDSYCGVVFQRSQFSFVRGNAMPAIATGTRHWRNAVAMARIADSGAWESPVEGALFFHARHVSPGWRLKRLAQVDNHIFYR